jgi:hypothetical protein
MTAPREPRVTDAQIRAWQGTGHSYKLIAAEMAEWARGKERGTALPDNSKFGRDLDVAVSVDTYRQAKRFLVAAGVLETSGGPFQVALPGFRPVVACWPMTAAAIQDQPLQS